MSARGSRFLVISLGVCLGLSLGCATQEPADLVVVNGTVITVDESLPEAQGIAVVGDRIVAVGDEKSIRAYIGEQTQVIDLEGRVAIPGIIESHAHFLSLGSSLMRLDLTKATSFDDIVEQVRQAAEAAEPGEWILGRGWHQEKWDTVPSPNVDGLPIHTALSAVSPDNPVVLTHASGHSCMANAKAMELGGVTRQTADPEGGEIVRDRRGNAIGVFRETAQGLVRRGNYEAEEEGAEAQQNTMRLKAAQLAADECLKRGITTFHDAGVGFNTIDFFKELVDSEQLPIRLYAMISEGNENLEERITDYRIIGYGDNRLTVRSIKRLIDGALGSHGAWLLEPYESLPTSTGLNTESVDVMKETARIAVENDFQLCTHAIGDRGNRETLDIYEEALTPTGDTAARRWRIEHSQHLDPADQPRFAGLGVIAAMQGIHCTSDGPWVFKRLGDKRAEEGAYMWRTLLDSGAVICNGTDAPVENVDPLASYYATVTRMMKNGETFFPEQRLTREEALYSYTMAGAFAGFEEDLKGSLTVGKLADITVLSQNILTVPDEELLGTTVDYTIVGGKVAFER